MRSRHSYSKSASSQHRYISRPELNRRARDSLPRDIAEGLNEEPKETRPTTLDSAYRLIRQDYKEGSLADHSPSPDIIHLNSTDVPFSYDSKSSERL